jgi:hypothetical protein
MAPDKVNPERISLVNPVVVVTSSYGQTVSGGGTFAGSSARARVVVSAVLGVTLALVAIGTFRGGAGEGGGGGTAWWGGTAALGSGSRSGNGGVVVGGGGGGFPEVRVFVNPKETQQLRAVQENWEHYHKGGSAAVRPLRLPELRKWPKGGGYPEITALIGRCLRVHIGVYTCVPQCLHGLALGRTHSRSRGVLDCGPHRVCELNRVLTRNIIVVVKSGISNPTHVACISNPTRRRRELGGGDGV